MLTKQSKRWLHGGLIGLVVFVLVSVAFWQGQLRQFEWWLDDVKMELFRADHQASSEVVVILVDEASLQSLDSLVGRWPWPRSVWADLIEFLSLGAAHSVVFDILFTERGLNERGELSDHDLALVDATANTELVTHAVQLLEDPFNPYPNRPLPDVFAAKYAVPNVSGIQASRNNTFYIPFNPLFEHSHRVGVVEFSPDNDGIYRRTQLFRDYQQHFYPVLSMSPLLDKLAVQNVAQSEGYLYLDQRAIPLDRNQLYPVNFYGQFDTYSIGSVLASLAEIRKGNVEAVYTDERLVSPELFENKIVFVGTSAVGLEDLKNTPVNNRWPGVFLHASIASNILMEDFIHQTEKIWVVLALFVVVVGVFVTVMSAKSIVGQVIYPLSLGLVILFLNMMLFDQYQWQFDLVPLLLGLVLTWLLMGAYLSSTEGHEKRRVRQMLAQYVSPAALNSVLDNYEDQLSAQVGKEEEMSIVFSDVRSFTSISEGLTAQDVVKMLNIHLDAMTQVTFDNGGTMDKFIGDATMAFWGAPLPDKDHAFHATLAAVEMIRRLVQVNQALQAIGMKPIQIGVGVNTGHVVLGNIGSSQKLDYTVIGDAVNLASRLESLTKEYHVEVLISEFTLAKCADRIPCALVDQVRVKGKTQPIKIYTPLALPADNPQEIARARILQQTTEQAFAYYHNRQFDQAMALYDSLDDPRLAEIKTIFIARCEQYQQQSPQADWDGVFTLTRK